MVGGVNMVIAIGTTLKIIIDWLELSVISIIVYTDLYSLYKCLVKLSITKEKCLIINIIVLQQSYERRELFEIQWINSQDNLVDVITKANLNKALKTFINTNTLYIQVEG
jgi:hypothetical protein